MVCVVNGKTIEINDGETLFALLERLELDPLAVVVEKNGDIIKRRFFNETTLADGDTLEVLSFVGGG